ncbi:MAG: exopolyphosphatase [Lachnospiraceae bacterium]|nr:exopolyphosphatase [Lachnospiraceae bacterium]
MAVKTFAAIDVGSSNLTMNIYEINSRNSIKRLTQVTHLIELGSDTYTYGKIRHELVNELCHVLQGFKQILKEYGVKDYKAYATSAIREADNNQMIIDQIRIKTGIDVQVISNSEQRFIMYKAIVTKDEGIHQCLEKNTAIIDIGAGSIQISLFDKKTLGVTQNIKIGSLRMRELLSALESETGNLNKILEEYIEAEIDTFKSIYLKDKEIRNIIVIGDDIHYMIKLLPKDKNSDIMNKKQFQMIVDKLAHSSPKKISLDYKIPYERASLLLPCSIVLQTFFRQSKAESVVVPKVEFCDGIVADYVYQQKKNSINQDFDQDIIMTANNIAKRYRCDKEFIRNVRIASSVLFDAMKRYSGLGPREKMLLDLAAILCECGKFINMNQVAKHSYHIIKATEIIGLSHREREMVAYIVKYSMLPYPSYFEVQGVYSAEDYLTIGKLAAILRVAMALNKSHKDKIGELIARVQNGNLVITVKAKKDITLERGLFHVEADFFEEVYGIQPVIKQRELL